MITTSTDCGSLYEAESEEQAYEPKRWCVACRRKRGIHFVEPTLDPNPWSEGDEAPDKEPAYF